MIIHKAKSQNQHRQQHQQYKVNQQQLVLFQDIHHIRHQILVLNHQGMIMCVIHTIPIFEIEFLFVCSNVYG